jgi:hypothetical protein
MITLDNADSVHVELLVRHHALEDCGEDLTGCFQLDVQTNEATKLYDWSVPCTVSRLGHIVWFLREQSCYLCEAFEPTTGYRHEFRLDTKRDSADSTFSIGPNWSSTGSRYATGWSSNTSITNEVAIVVPFENHSDTVELVHTPSAFWWSTQDTLFALTPLNDVVTWHQIWPLGVANEIGPSIGYDAEYGVTSDAQFIVARCYDDTYDDYDTLIARRKDSHVWTRLGMCVPESRFSLAPLDARLAWWQISEQTLHLRVASLTGQVHSNVLLSVENVSIDPPPTCPQWSPTGRYIATACFGDTASTIYLVDTLTGRHVSISCRGLVNSVDFLSEPSFTLKRE